MQDKYQLKFKAFQQTLLDIMFQVSQFLATPQQLEKYFAGHNSVRLRAAVATLRRKVFAFPFW